MQSNSNLDTEDQSIHPQYNDLPDTSLDTVDNSEINVPTQVDAIANATFEQDQDGPSNNSPDRVRNRNANKDFGDNSVNAPNQLSTPKTKKRRYFPAQDDVNITQEVENDQSPSGSTNKRRDLTSNIHLRDSVDEVPRNQDFLNLQTNIETQTDPPVANLFGDSASNILDNMSESPPDTPESQRILLDTNKVETDPRLDDELNEIQVGQTQDIRSEAQDKTIDTLLDVNKNQQQNGTSLTGSIENKMRNHSPTKATNTFTKTSFHRRESSNLRITEDLANIFNDDTEQEINVEDNDKSQDGPSQDISNTSNYWVFKNPDQSLLTPNAEKTTQIIASVKTDDLETQPILRTQPLSTAIIDSVIDEQDEILEPPEERLTADPVNSSINNIPSDQSSHSVEELPKKSNEIISSDKPTSISTQIGSTAVDVKKQVVDVVSINPENAIQVPTTSSPSKVIDDKEEVNNENQNPETVTSPDQHKHNTGRDSVFLKVSSRTALNADIQTNFSVEMSLQPDANKTECDNIVVSEVETTQEFPDITDSSDSSIKDIEESQAITSGRRSRHRKNTPKNDENEARNTRASKPTEPSEPSESTGTPEPTETTVSADLPTFYPRGIKTTDTEKFSLSDIIFPNSVWCFYDNFNYYPGLIEEKDPDCNEFRIKFEDNSKIMKEDDLYYLNIRIGDVITYMTDEYIVSGLECITENPQIIRCIRGYDTVYAVSKDLSAKNNKTIKVALSSVCITLDEWAMRNREKMKYSSNMILERESKQSILRPVLLRTETKSPRRKKKQINYNEFSDGESQPNKTDMENDVPEFHHNQPSQIKCSQDGLADGNRQYYLSHASLSDDSKDRSSSPKLSTSLNKELKKIRKLIDYKINVFENCLFVLSGLDKDRESELRSMISDHGGTIIEAGFSELFSYPQYPGHASALSDHNLLITWKEKSEYRNYKLACLITNSYSRRIKYLETLVLGWPVLHWRFILDSVKSGQIVTSNIMNYLLPAGKSTELDYLSHTIVIKSSNIFSFYTNLLHDRLLSSQLGLLKTVMSGYIIIKCNDSPISKFVEFSFCCLGVKHLFHFSVDSLLKGIRENTNEVSEIFQTAERENKTIMFYLDNDGTLKQQKSAAEQFRNQLEPLLNPAMLFYVWHKEWLIQTIITGTTGLS